MEMLATILFFLAVLHTFATKAFEHLARVKSTDFDFANGIKLFRENEEARKIDHFLARHPHLVAFCERHHGFLDLLGEVEFVFSLWGFVLLMAILLVQGDHEMAHYAEGLNFTEPLFVICIMAIAASLPLKQFAEHAIEALVRILPGEIVYTRLFVLLGVGPLLGSIITEPAAITIVAMLLAKYYYAIITGPEYRRLRYSILAVLLVNISIGGTLTHYAAPPVLMVAGKWGWDTGFMFTHFGWKAALAVTFNAMAVVVLNRKVLAALVGQSVVRSGLLIRVPFTVVGLHLVMLFGVVWFSHYPAVFLSIFGAYFFLAQAYKHYHEVGLYMRESVMVGLFLSGLVILGGLQKWWLQPLVLSLDGDILYWGATALTAITDNAALTYLGSQVDGLSDPAKYLLVAGAVTGGGLTIIANAPNPAGIGIVRKYFPDGAVGAGQLFMVAVPPTLVAAAAFLLL